MKGTVQQVVDMCVKHCRLLWTYLVVCEAYIWLYISQNSSQTTYPQFTIGSDHECKSFCKLFVLPYFTTTRSNMAPFSETQLTWTNVYRYSKMTFLIAIPYVCRSDSLYFAWQICYFSEMVWSQTSIIHFLRLFVRGFELTCT